MTDLELAQRYAPIIHFDAAETIPLRAIGYTIFRQAARSSSFPKRQVIPPAGAAFVIEYAYFWDYDIQHMYDLEHIWVAVDADGQVTDAESSFHGRYLKLLPQLSCVLPPTDGHVHAFCQPGKHAFLPDGQLFRLQPDWREACLSAAGGPVMVGGPFGGVYQPTEEDNAHCARFIREQLAFEPTMSFTKSVEDFGVEPALMPWTQLREVIPQRVRAECARLAERYAQA